LSKIAKGHAQHAEGDDGLMRHLTKTGKFGDSSSRSTTGVNGNANGEMMEQGYTSALRKENVAV
jgi:hypothetical protein